MARTNLTLVESEFFGPDGEEPVPPRLMRRISRTIWIGGAVAAIFVVGFFVWAALAPVAGAVSAPGVIKVENNRKTVKRLEPGVIRRLLVREGDQVRQGQLLIEFDDSQPKAQVAELASAYDGALAERARFEAEATSRASIAFPAELLARRGDPAVAAIIAAQQALFLARRAGLSSQVQIGRQRAEELQTQIGGVQAQVASVEAQLSLNAEELGGLQQLYSGGYAPRTRVLALQRSAAGLAGSRGEQTASIARAKQAIGETRLQVLAVQQQRVSEAAAGLQFTQDKIAALVPRLAAARDALSHTLITAPASGTVFNLSQFTEGGATGAGEALLDIVPTGQPLVIQARVEPQDAHAVRPGQKALLTLSAYNSRTTPRIEGEVSTLSADQAIDLHTGKPYFTAELRIPPDQLRRLPPEVKIYPGMPVSASIVNGQRTVLSYLFGPFVEMFSESMHEQ